jgi:hypothetical protein
MENEGFLAADFSRLWLQRNCPPQDNPLPLLGPSHRPSTLEGRAIEINPDFPRTHFRLGNVYLEEKAKLSNVGERRLSDYPEMTLIPMTSDHRHSPDPRLPQNKEAISKVWRQDVILLKFSQ